MHTNRNAIVYGLSAGSGLPGHIRFSRSEYRYSMLWFSLVIGFLQKKYTENLEVMKFFILSLSLSLSLSSLRAKYTKYHLIFNGLLITFSSKNHRIRSIPLSRLSIIRLQYVYGGMRQHGYVMSAYRLFYGYVTGNPVLTKIK